MAFFLTERYVLDYKVPRAFFAALVLPPFLSVTYVFICEGSAHVMVELYWQESVSPGRTVEQCTGNKKECQVTS